MSLPCLILAVAMCHPVLQFHMVQGLDFLYYWGGLTTIFELPTYAAGLSHIQSIPWTVPPMRNPNALVGGTDPG